MRQLLCLIVLLLLPVWLWGQPVSISRLKQQLAQATADTTRSRLLYELGKQYANQHPDSGLYFLNQSLAVSRQRNDALGMARALYQIGFTHHFITREEAKTIESLNQSIRIAAASNDDYHLASCYQLLALSAAKMRVGNNKEFLAKALYHAQQAKHWRVLTEVYAAYFSIYLTFDGNYPGAEKAVRQVMATCYQHDIDSWFTAALDYCDLLESKGEHQQSLAFAQTVAREVPRLRKIHGEFVYTCDLGRLYINLAQHKKAERIMMAGIASENRRARPDSLHLYYYYRYLTDAYVRQKDWSKAYEFTNQFNNIQLWLQRKRQANDAKLQMTEQKAAFDLGKKEKEIQQQRIYLIIALLFAALLIVFLVVQFQNRQRIERQKAELTLLNENLSGLNATKNKLFAMLSHDLWAPVDHLKSYLMLHNWGALSKEEFDQSARNLSNRLTHLQTLLENILNWTLSQMQGFRAYPQPVTAYPLIQAELELLNVQAAQKRIIIDYDLPSDVQLMVDPNHLSIIIRNLIQNAIKFTPSGGTISLRFQMINKHPQLVIADTGIGISAESLASLFQPDHEAARNGTDNERSTGLGLVLVRELMEANGGTVRAESQPEKGSTFTITFAPHPSPVSREEIKVIG